MQRHQRGVRVGTAGSEMPPVAASVLSVREDMWLC
jgi:hypothetical protein